MKGRKNGNEVYIINLSLNGQIYTELFDNEPEAFRGLAYIIRVCADSGLDLFSEKEESEILSCLDLQEMNEAVKLWNKYTADVLSIETRNVRSTFSATEIDKALHLLDEFYL